MTKKLNYVNHSYIGSYKVYCFNIYEKDSLYSNNYDFKYEEGDFLPLVSNNYVYSQNLLIIDFIKNIVHIVESSKYKKTIKIKGEVDPGIYDNFKSKSYMSIDVYGNILNVLNIYDLYEIMNSYPNVNLYLTENKFAKHEVKDGYKQGGYEDVYLYIDKIDNYSYNNLFLSGYTYSDGLNKKSNISCLKSKSSLELAKEIHDSIKAPLLDVFEENFYDKESIYFKMNYLLELFAVNYYLENNPKENLITYISCGKKKATHINRVKKDIIKFIENMEEEEILFILEVILSCCYDEGYIDSIISIISSFLVINN